MKRAPNIAPNSAVQTLKRERVVPAQNRELKTENQEPKTEVKIRSQKPKTENQKLKTDSVAGAFAELDGYVHFFAATVDGYGDAVAGALVVEDQVDVELTHDFLAVDGHDDVASDGDLAHACFRDTIAALNASSCGRTALRCSLHKQTLFHGQIQRFT